MAGNQMMTRQWKASGGLVVALALFGCAGSDNPTALSDLVTTLELEISAARVETLEEIEISTRVLGQQGHMGMDRMQMEIESQSGARVIEMERDGEGFKVHAIFFEEGEHHLTFEGRVKGHALMTYMGDREITVHNQHRIVGPYWIEMELASAPVAEGSEAHVHLHVHEFDGVGPGEEVSGVKMQGELHGPADSESHLEFSEEDPGEYEAAATFGEAGHYEIHLEIKVEEVHYDGEFNIPVIGDAVEPTDPPTNQGHGHG